MQASLSFRKDFPIPQLYIDRIRSIYKKCFPFSTKEKSTSVKRKIYIGILDKETKKNEGKRWFLANLSLKISKITFAGLAVY